MTNYAEITKKINAIAIEMIASKNAQLDWILDTAEGDPVDLYNIKYADELDILLENYLPTLIFEIKKIKLKTNFITIISDIFEEIDDQINCELLNNSEYYLNWDEERKEKLQKNIYISKNGEEKSTESQIASYFNNLAEKYIEKNGLNS